MTKTLIVAELSANHNGSKRLAIETVRAVAQTGGGCDKIANLYSRDINACQP